MGPEFALNVSRPGLPIAAVGVGFLIARNKKSRPPTSCIWQHNTYTSPGAALRGVRALFPLRLAAPRPSISLETFPAFRFLSPQDASGAHYPPVENAACEVLGSMVAMVAALH